MKSVDLNQWATALGAGMIATLAILPQARGELVYEEDLAAQQQLADPAARAEDRGNLRQAIDSSERAQATLRAQAPSQVPAPAQSQVYAPVMQQAPQNVAPVQVAAAEPQPEVQNIPKSELLRRARMRAELKNEDTLQERLEELRLRDEQRRAEQIFGAQAGTGVLGDAQPTVGLPQPLYTDRVQEQAVVAPVTDRIGQPAAAPVAVVTPVPVASAAPMTVAQADLVGPAPQGVSVSQEAPSDNLWDNSKISVSGRAGLNGMDGKGSYTIKPRMAGGAAIAIATSNNLSFELGYTYAEYGVAVASSNPFVQQYQTWQISRGYRGTLETVAMKQNVVDAGLKVHLLGPDAKIRPFLGAGGAYSKSFINYDQSILQYINADSNLASMGTDYELSSFLGSLSGGFDVKITKSISVGVLFKYYVVLTSRENQNLNNYGFTSSYSNTTTYPWATTTSTQDAEKQYVGGSLAKASFYSALAGVTFTF